jgi:hypothetical protein
MKIRTRAGRRLREPFGKAGLAVAILALVLGLIGGAWAAGGLTKAQEKQVTKIAKRFAGKPGAPGAPGAAGTNGTNGKPGANGKEGPEGSPWTAGGTLPSGKTETGSWAYTGTPVGEGYLYVPISFPIPLKPPAEPAKEPAISDANIHYVSESEWKTVKQPKGCEGGTAYAPLASPGNLCVYEGFGESKAGSLIGFSNPASSSTEGAAVSGTQMLFHEVGNTIEARRTGTFAVTAK